VLAGSLLVGNPEAGPNGVREVPRIKNGSRLVATYPAP
jgi:hypothetical protein